MRRFHVEDRLKTRFICALFASTCFVSAGFLFAGTSHAAEAVPTVSDGIGGVVTSSKGPEAGVWVIAETKDLPSRFIKIVVTDDQGRFLLPELPKAKYKLWVRGYGLVDSKPIDGAPGKNTDLAATIAPNAAAAAQYYPPNYWFALMHPPKADEFPGTGPQGNGIAPAIASQQMWLTRLKDQCQVCHQFGDKATREYTDNTPAGWLARVSKERGPNDQAVGNRGHMSAISMQNGLASYGRRGAEMYADWTARIAKGELPTEVPPRPQGIERNVVLTEWDWGNGRFVHDVTSTDRRNPSFNANGAVYGAANFTGAIEAFDPKTHTATEIGYSIIPGKGASLKHDIDAYPHNPMMDGKGRIWVTDIGRSFLPPAADGSNGEGQRADYCSNAAADEFAAYFPQPGNAHSTMVVYDPKTKSIAGIPACFNIHHLMFSRDKHDTLFFGGDGNVVGWLDTKVFDESHDPMKSQGWCPMVLDTKEKGVTKVALGAKDDVTITPDRTQWNQPAVQGRPVMEEGVGGKAATLGLDPKKDTRIAGFLYGMDENPKDGSMWFAQTSPFPNGLVRFERGSHPPQTCKTEYYQPPKRADGTYEAYDGRGVAMDTNGIAWVAFGSGRWGSFDRSKCKVLTGPSTATGQHCPEGWKFYDIPGPKMANTVDSPADYHYLVWVDQANTLGLGKDVPIAPGTTSDSLVVLDPKTGQSIHMRVPYPMGFYSRGLDGRIDNPKAGWKGRGLWATFSDVPVWHQEGGDEGKGPELVHFQLRPDPLAH